MLDRGTIVRIEKGPFSIAKGGNGQVTEVNGGWRLDEYVGEYGIICNIKLHVPHGGFEEMYPAYAVHLFNGKNDVWWFVEDEIKPLSDGEGFVKMQDYILEHIVGNID